MIKKLLFKLLAFWDAEKLRRELATLQDNHAAMTLALGQAVAQRDEYERELRLMQMEPNRAAALVAQMRVHAMFERGDKGFGVTMFIPETVLNHLRGGPESLTRMFTESIADNLVYRAVKGLWYRTNLNNVSAMIFDWKDKGKVHAVCMESADQAPRIAAQKIVPITLGKEKPALPTHEYPVQLTPPEGQIW